MGEKYKAYPEYKDSGVEWLGVIPLNWSKLPLKYKTYNKVKDGPHETPKFLNEGIPFFSVDSIQGNQLIFNGCRYISKEDHERFSLKCLPKKGDILLGKAASVGKVAYVNITKEFNVWSPLAVITPKNIKYGKFIYYSLQSIWLQAQCEVMSNSNTQKNLSMQTIDNLLFAFPNGNTANQIANFLDHETGKIDRLIEKQQELIKLLKEKRQAVISHAVTKGLNPDVPLKDSGVEWLGEVPEHWEIRRIKHVGKIIGGYAFKSSDFTNKGVKVIKIANVSHLSFDWTDSSFLPNDFTKEHSYYIPPINSLVFAMTRPIISGGVKVAKLNLEEKFLINQRVGFLKPSSKFNQDYLMYVAQSKSFFNAFANNITATNQPNISAEGIEDIRFACPNLEEQNEIVNHVTDICNLIEKLIIKANYADGLLKERRTALISAAVTGKIDVRNWKAPNHSNSQTEEV